nr:HAD-IC family P-type ATPase [Streptomyces sp. SA3_actF]
MRALAALPEAERAVRAARGRVFARCAPEDKAWLVARTRAAGRVTGFLGDGWNDVPALRAADVGLCPPGAVALAREHADLVLGGKDLGAVAHAVRAGRSGTATVLAYLRAALSSNLGNVVAMLVAGLLLPFLPMLPAQVLVQNLCFDLAQTAYVRRGAAARPSARPVPLRTRALVRQILGYGALNAGGRRADLRGAGVGRGGCGGDAVAGALPRGVVHREPAHAGARARGAAAGGGPGAEGAVGGGGRPGRGGRGAAAEPGGRRAGDGGVAVARVGGARAADARVRGALRWIRGGAARVGAGRLRVRTGPCRAGRAQP